MNCELWQSFRWFSRGWMCFYDGAVNWFFSISLFSYIHFPRNTQHVHIVSVKSQWVWSSVLNNNFQGKKWVYNLKYCVPQRDPQNCTYIYTIVCWFIIVERGKCSTEHPLSDFRRNSNISQRLMRDLCNEKMRQHANRYCTIPVWLLCLLELITLVSFGSRPW